MPAVSRRKDLPAPPESVYALVSDPRRLREWWPRVVRVEDIAGKAGDERSRWTAVLESDSGRMLRLDYRCSAATRPSRFVWEQELEDTAFSKHLLRQAVEARIEPGGDGSRVTLTAIHELRGSARLAGFAMKKSQRQLLDDALDGLTAAIGEKGSE